MDDPLHKDDFDNEGFYRTQLEFLRERNKELWATVVALLLYSGGKVKIQPVLSLNGSEYVVRSYFDDAGMTQVLEVEKI